MNHDSNKKKYVIGALFLTLTLYLIFSVSGALYAYTDNITVGVVTSGMYGDNNMCQYLHPLLCLIIKGLNPLLPTADVFALLTHLALAAGVFLISYAVIEKAFRRPLRDWKAEDFVNAAVPLLSICYFSLGLKLFGVNYTVQTAAILAEGIIILFYACHNGKGKKWIIAGTALVFAALLGRLEACLLFLPFLTLELLTEFARSKDRITCGKQIRRYILPSLVVIATLLGTKWLFLQTEPYKSDAAYNGYRTITEDYPMETYGVTYKDFSEIDHDIYLMVTHWNLADTDLINTESLKKISEVGSRNGFRFSQEGFRRALGEMKRVAATLDVHIMTLLALAAMLTLWTLFTAEGPWLKLEAFLCFLGGFMILFYFTFRGRAPVRVWQCTLIAGLTILVFVMIKAGAGRQQRKVRQNSEETQPAEGKQVDMIHALFGLLLCIILYFGIGQVMAHSTIHKPTSPLTAKIGADDSGYEETLTGDALYFWPYWYSAVPDYFSAQDKLPTKRVIEHNIPLGDWVYGQVYFRNFLEQAGAGNPVTALLERPDTYLVEGQEEMVMNYIHTHYGEDIELEYVRKINGKKVYRLMRGND